MRAAYCLLLPLTLLLLFSFSAVAIHQQPYHLKLLAVEESSNGFSGSPADLFLEVKDGSGRVFLETYPLTKVDTQASTRFAKDIACTHYKLPCSKYDFIYTIKAESNIIGGPSAGAAIAALTAVALLDLEYDQGVSITGTINSGGLVGTVGGIGEKIKAGEQAGLKKVLIPKGSKPREPEAGSGEDKAAEGTGKNETNETLEINQTLFPASSIEVVEVIDLDEVLFHLTGKDLNHRPVSISENQQYAKIMSGLADILCSRTGKIEKELEDRGLPLTQELAESLQQRQGKSQNASQQGDYYSAASFCFGSNIQLKAYYYEQEEVSLPQLEILFAQLEKKVKQLEENIAKEKIETISDLQALMIVQERLHDVRQSMEQFQSEKEQTPAGELAGLLAYAEERYFSAISWMQFFAMEGKIFTIDDERLKRSCQQKILEGEERIQYVNLYVGEVHLTEMKERMELAKNALKDQQYALCLMEAAQAKAQANALMSILGLPEELLDEFIDSKGQAAQQVIVENTAEGVFPIMGFSYYQYANSLKGTEKYTALVYLENALEMSDLQIYFPEEAEGREKGILPAELETVGKRFLLKKEVLLVGAGILTGAIAVFLIVLVSRAVRGKKPVRQLPRKRRKPK